MKSIFVILSFVILFNLQAQNDYLVSTKGEIIYGKISFNFNSPAYDVVTIKTDEGKKTLKSYQVQNIFYGNDTIDVVKLEQKLQFGIRINKNSFLSHYKVRILSSFEFDTEVLVKNTGEFIEIPNMGFKNGMARFMEDCPRLSIDIKNSKYGKSDLNEIIRIYNNDCDFGENVKNEEITVTKSSKTYTFDKSAVSGTNLKKVNLKGQAGRTYFEDVIYSGEDLRVLITSSQSWEEKIKGFESDELTYLFNGMVSANDKVFTSGNWLLTPKGFEGTKTVNAGNNFNHSLVIRPKTINSEKGSTKDYLSGIDPTILSGISISLNQDGFFSQTVLRGEELSVKLNGQKPVISQIDDVEQEQLIVVLSGQINVGKSEREYDKYYTGDFFVMPKGFTGIWTSLGNEIVKYLTIEKTK